MDEKVLDEDKSKAKTLKVKGGIIQDEYTTDYEKSLIEDEQATDGEPEIIIEIPEHKTEAVKKVGKSDKEIIKKQENAKKSNKVDERTLALLKEAEAFIAEGDYENAEESFYQSMISSPKSWRGYFGVVRAATEEFSNLDDVSDLTEVYQKGISLLDNEGRAELDKKYTAKFTKQVKDGEKKIKELKKSEEDAREERITKYSTAKKSSGKKLIIFGSCCAVCIVLCIVGIMLAFKFTGTNSMICVISSIVSGVVGGVLLILLLINLRKFNSSSYFLKKYRKFETTPEGIKVGKLEHTNELLNEILQDIKIVKE